MPRGFQPSFRVALSLLIVGLVTLAVLAVGTVSFRFGRENATDLSGQVLEQTLHRIELRIQSFLRVAVRQSRLGDRLLRTGRLAADEAGRRELVSANDFSRLTAYFGHTMRVEDTLTNLGIGLEATGEFCMVARRPEGLTSVNYLLQSDGTMRIDTYEPLPNGRRFTGPKPFDGYDPRKRPFYRAAVEAGAPTWTEAYLFFGAGGRERVPGVTYATPIRDGQDDLVGVMHADFDLYALCNFLDGLRAEVPGFAFVLERRRDGSLRAIAHPDPATLLHESTNTEGTATVSLAATVAQMGDARVPAFLDALPDVGGSVDGTDGTIALEIEHEGRRYLGAYRLLGGDAAPAWSIGMMIPRETIMEAVERNNRQTLWIALASLAVASLLSVLIASRISTPLERIAGQFADIGRFELEAPSLGRSSITELDRLMVATDEMKASLRSFEKYVPARLVREMTARGVEAELGGESRRLTVYFSHIVDFETHQAELGTEELVSDLGVYFAEVSRQIESHQGTLDKYMGDAVMAFWGAPHPIEDHALEACRAAVGAVERTRVLGERLEREGRTPFRACIGINTGELVVGNMGSRQRLNYTVIGDAVNLAARLEGLNRVYGTAILLGEETLGEVGERVLARRIDRVAVKGRTRGVEVYELLALAEEATEAQRQLRRDYELALDAYLARRWDQAVEAFEDLLVRHPSDGPSHTLLDRCREYQRHPPPDDWDGVYVMTRK